MGKVSSSKVIERLDKLNEFEREPVSFDKLLRGRHFAGAFAGEHVAGTEFVIGALFVSTGAHTCDVIFGLIVGNLLAVLSWFFVCAPIAIKTRLTLYWYLRKIAGPIVMIVYNILNAVMYCILAGAMITVAASAVRIPFGIPVQIGWLPQDIRFVGIVLVLGAGVVILAIWGFKKLAQFSEVCAPWIFMIFIIGAIAMLPVILATTPEITSIRSLYDFWQLADARIWPGPQLGQSETLGFLHIVSFAWMCNLAMHLGLSDMALLRYAKKVSYGLYSAFGMYLGHFLAWICAGIMGAGAATLLKVPLSNLDAGEVATTALGTAGAIAVVISGWTTANPTIYRAGLALQVITPNWPRWLVTLAAGVITTLVACSPWVFTKLLEFVGIYGLLLMPVGAIVVVEHWIFPHIGLAQYWSTRKGQLLNLPALLAWFISITGAFIVRQFGYIHLFFLTIPVWLCSAVAYTFFSFLAGASRKLPELAENNRPIEHAYKQLAQPPKLKSQKSVLYYTSGLIALISLLFCIGAAIWVLKSDENVYTTKLNFLKTTILYNTVIYFVSATVWLTFKDEKD